MFDRLSVRPFVKHVNFKKVKETCASTLTPHERSFILVSSKKNGWWGSPILPEILGQTDPVGAKTPIFNRYLV